MRYHYQTGLVKRNYWKKSLNMLAIAGWTLLAILVLDAIFNQSRIITKGLGG